MTIQDVPFKRAVRASMPPHVEKHFTAPRPAHLMNLIQLRPDFPNVPLFRNCALASSKVATRSESAMGPVVVIDQNQRRLSGPPRVA